MTERSIYFIKPVGMDGPVKIGISARSDARLVEMLEWSPFDLEIAHTLPGTYKLERMIQEALAKDHIRREWFRPTERVIKLLADLRAGVPLDLALDLTRKEGTIRRPSNRQSGTSRKSRIVGASGITEGQRDCLDFIRGFIASESRSPTYQEICGGLGLHSKSGVHRYVLALVERGHLARTPGRNCSLALVDHEPLARAA